MERPLAGVGKYGEMRLNYLRRHDKTAYGLMLLEGTLKQHLLDVDEQAHEMVTQIMNDLSIANPPPDKVADPMGWIEHITSLISQAEEEVKRKFINT